MRGIVAKVIMSICPISADKTPYHSSLLVSAGEGQIPGSEPITGHLVIKIER
jgi:hypothetical protein